MKNNKPKYFIPPEHIQKGIIGNTPLWLREHFRNEGRKKVRDAVKKLKKEFRFTVNYEGIKTIINEVFAEFLKEKKK